jgi:PBS lyase HEAT-like repeat
MRMRSNRIIAVIVLIAGSCTVGVGQELAARYYSEKAANPLGEAVFLLVELTNISSRTVEFDDGFCPQWFKPVVPIPQRGMDKLYGCTGGGTFGSCLGSFVDLKPGEKVLRRHLLPDGLEPETPGDFDYTVERKITFYSRDGSHKVVSQQDVNETFTIRVVQSNRSQLEVDYAPLVADLQSREPEQRTLAASAITRHPQEFLEPVILRLSLDAQTMSASITGLKKLGTVRAKQRLAELTASTYEEDVRQPATTALAELGDISYCDLMLQLMNLRQGYTSEIAAKGAGFLCGQKAIPHLVSLLSRNSGAFPAYEIAYALGNTRSRDAMPTLIELLRNPDADIHRAAKEALYSLTHRMSDSDIFVVDYQDWVSWWALEGEKAEMYDPTECP